MTEAEARQKLSEWEGIADLHLTTGISFTDYHIDRIKREKNGIWDESYANQYVTSLILDLKDKYGHE